jgi:RP/EB family microtubule-associated protein
MAVQGESFGINDECYKVGRTELLTFFNEHLELQLSKIEQCGTGAVYCGLMDKLYPGTFNFGAVKWGAKNDFEYMDNYKVLNNAFVKNGVKKNLEVDKLVKCRLLDNTEMCQWIKKYFELHYGGHDYDPIGRRKGQEMHYIGGVGGKAPVVAKSNQFKPKSSAGAAARTPMQAAPKTSMTIGKTSGASTAAVGKLEAQVAEL